MSINVLEIAVFFLFSVFTANAQSAANYSYIGGIPLRTPDSCPDGSLTGQITFERNCCPADQTFVKVEGSVCCEDSSDCYSEVIAAPKCADPSWQLCGTNQGGFCCQQNWVCFTETATGTNGGGVGCSTPGATLSAGQSEVTIVYDANAGPDASTTAAPSSSSAAPTTSDSTTPTLTSASVLSSSSDSQVTSAPKTSSNSRVTPSTDSTVSSTSTKPASSSSSSTSSSSTSSSSIVTKKSSPVGGGAIAGIVVGALALLCLAFAGGVWFNRRKRNSDSSDYFTWGKPKTQTGVSEMEDASHVRRELEAHVPGKGVVYGAGNNAYSPASELPAPQGVVELDAGYSRPRG